MDSEVRALSTGMRDPLHPTFCAACLHCVFLQVKGEGLSHRAFLRELRANHHDFWRGVMYFLTVRRTAKLREVALDLLVAGVSACRSRSKAHIDAVRTLAEGDHLLYMVVNMCFNMVDACLAQSQFKAVKARKFSTHGLWPTSADDLLPAGAEDSLSSFLHWLLARPDSSIQTSLQDLYLACRPQLEPYLMMDGNRRLFVQTIAKHICASANWLERTPPSKRFTNLNIFDPAMLITSLTGLLQFAMFDPHSTSSHIPRLGVPHRLVGGMEEGLIAGFVKAYALFEDGVEKSQIGDVLTTLYDSRGTPPPQRPAGLQSPFAAAQKMLGSAGDMFQREIRSRRDTGACGAAGCTVHERDIGRRLQRCSGCAVLQYCSRECQRRDWKDAKYPHKEVCARLKSLVPFLDCDGDGFAAGLDELHMKVRERAAIHVNLVNGSMRGLQDLSTEEQIEQISTIMKMHEFTRQEGGEIGQSVLVEAMRALGLSA
ncbi:hypothetical protein EXIGLDRAFT_843251, partial [Exidia glandulosa HHB12029]